MARTVQTSNDDSASRTPRVPVKSSALHYFLQRIENDITNFRDIVARVGEIVAFSELRKLVAAVSAECRDSKENMLAVHHWFDERLNPILHESELCKYCYDKPRGYSGDFGAIELIWKGHTAPYAKRYVGTTIRGQLINAYSLGTENCRANIDRIIRFRKILCGFSGQSIASIGCGSAIELCEAYRVGGKPGVDVHLFDQDESALDAAQSQLVFFPLHVHCYGGNVIRNLISRKQQRFDLIYSSGVFNYLELASARKIAEVLWNQLNAGGSLIICNAHPDNPTRVWMECVSHWYLIYKTEDQMSSLARGLVDSEYVKLEKDAYGVYQYLVIRKQKEN
ncbi:MAG: class I SAM-dependent methyltransferase [Deltaproteobacteria bacterium]|nr:class I SAM-dependent methyltransferase [Deltaproteobacteria bacterium]